MLSVLALFAYVLGFVTQPRWWLCVGIDAAVFVVVGVWHVNDLARRYDESHRDQG